MMIMTILCSLALQSTPSHPPRAASDDFFIGQNQQRGGGESAPGAQDVVARTYDVRVLGLGGWDAQRAPRHLRLVPSADFLEPEDSAPGTLGTQLRSESWINLLVDLLGRGAQGEGRSVVVSPSGQLHVTGPPALHASVEGLLELLAGAASDEVRLTIDVARRRPADLAGLAGALVTLAEAEALVQGGSEHHELTVRDDTGGVLEALRQLPVLIAHETDVASGAAIPNPTILQSSTGTRLIVRAARAAGGTHLALAIKRNDLSLDRRAQGIEISTRHVGDDGRALTSVAATHVEDPTWTTSAFASSCFVPRDRALVLLGSSDPELTELLVLRVDPGAAEAGPAARSVRFDDGSAAALVHLGAYLPPQLQAEGAGFLHGGEGRWRGTAYDVIDESRSFLTCRFEETSLGAQRDVLLRGLGRGFDHWELGGWLAVRGDARALADLAQPPSPAPSLTVDLRLEHGGKVLRSARFPLRIGSAGGVVSTREQLDATDYNIEIAESSAATSLRLQHVLDGLACWLRALPLTDGRLVLETAGLAQLAGPRRPKAMFNAFVSALEERDVEQLVLRGRRTVTRGEDGAYRTVLGAVRGDGLRVVIELR